MSVQKEIKQKVIKDFEKNPNQTLKVIGEKYNVSKRYVSMTLTQHFENKLKNKQ